MSVRKVKINKNNSVDIHDIWMPEILGLANQILKVNKDKTGLEFGNLLTKSSFINGAIVAGTNEAIDTTSVKNKIYFMQCYDSESNLQEFTVSGVSKSVKGKFAMVIFGKDYVNSLAIVQTGSALISELAKTTSRVNGFIPSKGNVLRWYEIDGTLEAFKGDKGDSAIAVTISAPASAVKGDLTVDQLSILQASDDNYIVFNNEIYRLADKQHTTGILSYTHTGWNGTAMLDKSINITVSTRAWTLVVGQEGGGTNVVANPGTGTTRITDIQIDNTKYFILPEKYEQYLRDATFTEPTVTLAVTMETQPVKDNKYLYGQTVVASISHREVKNDALSLNSLALYWRDSAVQLNITPSIGTLATIVSSESYTLSTSNNRFELKLLYTSDDLSIRTVSSYKTIDAGYALFYKAGNFSPRFDVTNMKNIISSGTVNISVTTTENQKISIAFPGTVTARTNAAFSTEVPLTLVETVDIPIFDDSIGSNILVTTSYNIYQTEALKAGTNDIILTLGGN